MRRRGFKTVECVGEEYYDEFGRFREIPRYVTAECLCVSYDWGRACVEYSDLEILEYLRELDVYAYVNEFPGTLIDRVAEVASDDDIEYLEFRAVSEFGESRGIELMIDRGFIPIDHHLVFSCRFEELVECVENFSKWVHDFLEFINEEGEKILAKYSPQDLELVTCSFCGAVMRRYLLGRHVEEHEVKEAGEELKLLKKFLEMVDGVPDIKDLEESFPKAVERHRSEVLELLKRKWLSSRHSEEIAREVSKYLVEGEVIGLHNFGKLARVYRLLLEGVPDYVLEEFISSKTSLPSILSEGAMRELMRRLKTRTPIREGEGCGEDFSVGLVKKEKRNALKIYVVVKCGNQVLASVRLGPMSITKLREELTRKIGSEVIVNRIISKVEQIMTSSRP